MYFRNKGLQKTWLEKCLKNRYSEHRSTAHMLKDPKDCWNLQHSTFVKFYHHYEGNRVSLLGISQILGLLVNTLTSDDKYSPCNRDNLWQPIQIHLSNKQNTFS